MINISFNKKSR